jgi:hypothetical protein
MLPNVRKYWRVLVSVTVALLLPFALPKVAMANASQELLAFFGLIMAGVLPAMVLAASSLRAGSLSSKRIQSLFEALVVQMRVWAGLFLIALVASLLVLLGKFTQWSIQFPSSWQVVNTNEYLKQLDLIWLINGAIIFCLSLLSLRAMSVIVGLRSLLRLSAEISISEANEREQARFKQMEEELRGLPDQPSRGSYVDLPH